MPTLETINVGLAPNDKKGDPLRNAMQKVNLNFSALNTAIQGVLDGKGQANGYASLGADGRLLAAQAPIVYSAALPTTAHDLNTYVTPGTFYQTTVAGATAGANYPVLNVGFLEVVATGTPVLQVYTVRSNVLASMQRFWRVRQTAALWSAWKEISDTSTALSYQGGMAAAQDLNTYTQRGMWIIGSSATAAGGTNFPIGQSGSLIVFSAGYPGGPVATSCTQLYFAANSGQTFTRSLVSATWTPWVRSVDSGQLGAANGVATLNAAGQVVQGPSSTALFAGDNLNTITNPGLYGNNADAYATVANNYPVALAGTLTVNVGPASNLQVTQQYTTRETAGPRTFVRVRFGSGLVWSAWRELADAAALAAVKATADAAIPIAQKDANGGVAPLDSTRRIPEGNGRFPALQSLPDGTDFNAFLVSDDYYIRATAPNAPSGWSGQGMLRVRTYASMTLQEIVRWSAAADRWWRMKVDAAGNWSPWLKVADTGTAMTRTALTVATDANTLTADNTFYTWNTQTVMTGANFPNIPGAGYMRAYVISANIIAQELVVIVTGRKPYCFYRTGNLGTSTWQTWRVTAPFSVTSSMPNFDAGDIQVDGALGMYRWSGALASYVQSPPTPTLREGCRLDWASASTITVNPGRCASFGGEVLLELLAANTRTLQSSGAFVHGTSGNALLSGARAAGTQYYAFLLRRNSDGAVCVAFDTTFNCANRPATHSHYRRIGCFVTDSFNNIRGFLQVGNDFWFAAPLALFSGVALTPGTIYTPNSFTPVNVAHIIKLTGFLTTSQSSSLLTRHRQGSNLSEWIYAITAFLGANSIADFESPMAAVAAPTLDFQAVGSVPGATVLVKGYTDQFED